MSHDNLYKGPSFDEPQKVKEPGEYTVIDQARGFGVPDEQLFPEAQPLTVTIYKTGGVREEIPTKDIVTKKH